MSFLKITDLTKREASVKEFLDLKKRIKDNFRSERMGEMEMQTDLSKFFKPITETQKATAKEIMETQKATAKEIAEELKPKNYDYTTPETFSFKNLEKIKAQERTRKRRERRERKQEEKEKEERKRKKRKRKKWEKWGKWEKWENRSVK